MKSYLKFSMLAIFKKMSVQIIGELIYLKIASILNLRYDFINTLYRSNQKAYDLTYGEKNEVNDLPSFEILKDIKENEFNNNTDLLILKLRSIRYNIYSNGGNTYANKNTLEKLDNLISFLEVNNKQTKLSEVKTS